MFTGYGNLLYYSSWWLVLKVDDDFGKYYRNIVNYYSRSISLNPPKNGSHITVIAGKYEQPKNEYKHLWNKYLNEKIEFKYDNNDIKTDNIYFWISIQCERIEEIRKELGLNSTIKYPWHLTIGNLK